MSKRNGASIAAAFLLWAVSWALSRRVLAQTQPEVIYGPDGRADAYQIQDQRLRQMMDSTVALFDAGAVNVDPQTGKASLRTSHYGKSRNLCPDEPFYDQQKGAFCSGSLVGPDLVMTAGHCIRSQENCASTKFVFGFQMSAADADPSSVPSGEVYGCAELLGSQAQSADWALVRLDRAAPNHKPLAINRAGDIAKDTALFVIGHPAGLPAKIAGGAQVRDASQEGYLVANLDTYGGNSGSAVFNAKTGLIEGILVRGETDYESRGECTVSKRCPDDGCRGEDVTKISVIASKIPPLTPSSAMAAGERSQGSLNQGVAFTSLKKLAAPREN